IATKFSAGVKTNGRAEAENRINKIIGHPKKTLLEVFTGLNKRTEDQTALDLISMLRKYAGPFALHTCYKQMEYSMYYLVEVVPRPPNASQWNMINAFENDAAYISTVWLLQLIKWRGLEMQHILHITHKATGKVHHLVILQDKRYICDCCMGLNLGIPCRHYFTAWTSVQGLPFHIGLV
ncbi:hypothetical protein BDZ94DRAFT_1115273, partial [Collybia nuda]